MTIIINDFEVVVEERPKQDVNTKPPVRRPEMPPSLRPDEIIRIERWQERRLKRLWAD